MNDIITQAQVLDALAALRAPLTGREYDLHAMVAGALEGAGIPLLHEAVLGPRCRIDFLAGDVGIEIKRGKPVRGRLMEQLGRYMASDRLTALVLVVERTANVPRSLCGKPLHLVSLNRLWGIAL